MDYDMKWFVLVIVVFMGIPLLGLGLETYQNNQCRIEAIKANMEPEKIAQVCKR